MSKIRTLLGGLAAVGIIAALGAGGVLSASSVGVHPAAARATTTVDASAACWGCISGD
jgi:hypothetical protein